MIRFKQNGFKRALALLLSVFMVLSVFNFVVFATETITHGDWTITNEEASGTAVMSVNGVDFTYHSLTTVIEYSSSGGRNYVKSYNTNGSASNGIVSTSSSSYCDYTPTSDGTLRVYVGVPSTTKTGYVSRTSVSDGKSEALGSFVPGGTDNYDNEYLTVTQGTTWATVDIEAEAGYIYYITLSGSKMLCYGAEFTPYVKVSGTVSGDDVSSLSYGLTFTNNDTSVSYEATVDSSDNTYSITLKPGYTYTVALSGTAASDHAVTSSTKSVTVSSGSTTQTADITIEACEFYTLTGNVSGIASSYSYLSDLKVVFTPSDSSLDTVSVSASSLSYSAQLVSGASYTVSIEGAYDYELSGTYSTVSYSGTTAQTLNITLAEVDTYAVSGGFLGLNVYGDGYDTLNVIPSAITFENVDDGYAYTGTASEGSYSVSLRNGTYLASIDLDGYSTSTHVTVYGADTTRDLLLKSSSTTSIEYTDTLYVGENQEYKTVQAAVDAATSMSRTSSQRVTIAIDPGTYREQVVISTPNITFKGTGSSKDDTTITWYYGIGYQYYSCVDSYYDPYAAYDKYNKNDVVSYWGSAVITKNTAKGFKAENIKFENSFNKYMTEEEIEDGVAEDSLTSTKITFERTSGANVDTKEATERAAAFVNYADQVEFNNCSFISSQDTLYTCNYSYDLYFKDCYIEGQTDYIYGNGDVIFDGCELNFCGYDGTYSGGYITAQSASSSYPSTDGYIFKDCKITYNTDTTRYYTGGYLGRLWGENATVAFINTILENTVSNNTNIILPAGWDAMSDNDPTTSETAKLVEYNSRYSSTTGTLVDTSSRATKAKEKLLTADTYDPWDYSVEEVFIENDWTPSYYAADTAYLDFTDSNALVLYDTNASSTFKGNEYGVYAGIYKNDDNEEFKTTVYDNIYYYDHESKYGIGINGNTDNKPVFSFKAENAATYTIEWTKYDGSDSDSLGLYTSYDSTNGLSGVLDSTTLSADSGTLTYTKTTSDAETIYVGSAGVNGNVYIKSFTISTNASENLVTGTVDGLEEDEDETAVSLTFTNVDDSSDFVTAYLSDLTGSGVNGLTVGESYSVTAVGNGVYTSIANATVGEDKTIAITVKRIEFKFPLNLSENGETYKSYFSIQGLLDSSGSLTADTTDYYSGITVYANGMNFTEYFSNYGAKTNSTDILSFTAEETGTLTLTFTVTTSNGKNITLTNSTTGESDYSSVTSGSKGAITLSVDVTAGDTVILQTEKDNNLYYSYVGVSYETVSASDKVIVEDSDGTRYIVFGISDSNLSSSSFGIVNGTQNVTKDGSAASFDTVYKAVQFPEKGVMSASDLIDGYSYVIAFSISDDDDSVTNEIILAGFSLDFN